MESYTLFSAVRVCHLWKSSRIFFFFCVNIKYFFPRERCGLRSSFSTQLAFIFSVHSIPLIWIISIFRYNASWRHFSRTFFFSVRSTRLHSRVRALARRMEFELLRAYSFGTHDEMIFCCYQTTSRSLFRLRTLFLPHSRQCLNLMPYHECSRERSTTVLCWFHI